MINQKEYLKKYLSSGDSQDKKKKKKKKLKVGPKTVKIIDDDIDVKNIKPLDDAEFGIFIDNEDAPQIVGIVDERGPIDFADKRRWRIIANDGEEDISFASGDKIFRDGQDSNEYKKKKKHKNSDLHNDKTEERNKKLDSDSDMSPPRQKSKHEDKDLSSSRHRRRNKNSDPSPPRRRRKDEDSDPSPSRRRRKDEDSDPSPPRRRRKDEDSDPSPPRRRQRTDDSDLSPPRQRGKNDDSDLSPPRQRRKNYDSDLSPPRQRRKDHEHNMSSPRRSKRGSQSPRPGNSKHHRSSHTKHSDKESRRKQSDKPSRWSKNEDGDLDLPRRRKDVDIDSHSSNAHGKRHRTDNHHAREEKNSNERRKDRSSLERGERMKKTLDGKTAGLQDAKALREETEAYKKREAEHFRQLSKEITGVGQAAVVRDTKTGRKRNLEAEAAEEREKEKRQHELNEKYAKWGKGLKQVEDHAERLKDDLYEMSKPLARYADDADLDKRLREQEREGDPMLEYIKQKQIKEGKRKPEQPQYQGSFMPNRFGIKPGHRWDGVDRSNGYEKKWFEAQNAKVARQEEAYKWSTADM